MAGVAVGLTGGVVGMVGDMYGLAGVMVGVVMGESGPMGVIYGVVGVCNVVSGDWGDGFVQGDGFALPGVVGLTTGTPSS